MNPVMDVFFVQGIKLCKLKTQSIPEKAQSIPGGLLLYIGLIEWTYDGREMAQSEMCGMEEIVSMKRRKEKQRQRENRLRRMMALLLAAALIFCGGGGNSGKCTGKRERQ